MRCFYQRSDDDGITWTRPVEITETFAAFRKDYDWKVLATGPNHSIQLQNGRLVVPVWMYVICWLVALPLVAGIELSPTATLPFWRSTRSIAPSIVPPVSIH